MGAAIGKEAAAAGKGAANAAESAANHGLANETARAGENAASHGAAKADAKAASDATGSSVKTNTQGGKALTGKLVDKLPSGDTALKVGGAAYVANTVKDMGKNVDKQFGEIGEVVGGCEGKSGKELEDCKKKGKAYVYIGFGVVVLLILMPR